MREFQFVAVNAQRVLLAAMLGTGLPLYAQNVDLPEVSLLDEAAVASVPEPRVGEVREFIGNVGTMPCTRWEVVESDREGFLMSQCEQYKIYLKRDASFNMQQITANDEVVLEFKPYYPVIEFPLQVGKSWRGEYAGHSVIEDAYWDGKVKCEVADFTDVEVAAGTFKAYRIECQDRWKAAGMESSINTTTWYAPDIAAIVKTITYEDPRWNSELKAYSR
jgi:hypothetical protein